MARRPNVQSDRDNWGAVLNDYLDVSLAEDGTIRPEAVPFASTGAPTEPERTLSVVGDVHIGIYPDDPSNRDAAIARQDETFADLATLAGMHARRVYVGDLVDIPDTTGTTPSVHDLDFISRADALDNDWLAVPGNHDIASSRTAADWAQVYGFEGGNWVRDLGFCRIIGIASDGPSSPLSTMPTETLTFLDAELTKSRKDTIVLCHFPLYGSVAPHPVDKGYSSYSTEYPSSSRYASPAPDIFAVLDRHPQARVWLNGHSHSPISAPDLFTQVWTGTRHIVSINAGAIPYTNANVGAVGDDPPRSIFLTMLDDRCEVRIRNHRDGAWERYRYAYVYPERWAVPTMAAAEDNPATLVMTFDEAIVATDRYGEADFTFTGTASYETLDGLTGLVMDGSDILSVDPRPYLTPDTGSIVIRARFTAESEETSNYIAFLQPDSPSNQRINLARLEDGSLIGQFGTAGGSATSIAPMDDTDMHTIAISWRDGWLGLLYVDGRRQQYAYSSNDLSTVITTIGDELRLGMGRNVVLYGVYLATRELTPGEHDRLHRAIGPWGWDTLNPRAGAAVALAPDPDPDPDPDPPSVPLTMVATFDNAIEAEDREGPVSPTGAPASPSYDTADGRTGISLAGTSGNRITFDPRDWITPGTGTVVVRARFANAMPDGTEYVVYHSPSDPTNHRLHVMRQSEAVRAQIGGAIVPASSAAPLEDTDIHTFAISWRNGWECSLWLDGIHQADGRSAATEGDGVLTTIGVAMDFVRNQPMVVYEIAMADGEISEADHITLHNATDPWSLTMFDEG